MNRKPVVIVTTLVLVASMVIFAPVASAASTKIGVINLRKALSDSNAGKAAMKKLDQKHSKNIEKKMKAIKAVEDKISLRGKMLKEDEKKALQDDYYKKRNDFAQLRESIVKEEREMSNKIIKEILVIARKVGQEEGYVLVLEKGQNVIFSIDSIDITKKVIERHNEVHKAQ